MFPFHGLPFGIVIFHFCRAVAFAVLVELVGTITSLLWNFSALHWAYFATVGNIKGLL